MEDTDAVAWRTYTHGTRKQIKKTVAENTYIFKSQRGSSRFGDDDELAPGLRRWTTMTTDDTGWSVLRLTLHSLRSGESGYDIEKSYELKGTHNLGSLPHHHQGLPLCR